MGGTDAYNPEELIKRFRDKLISRGARGIIGLQRLFKIMDDDYSKSLNEYEFSKAIKDFRIDIPDEALHIIFSVFDVNRDGTVQYDEFLRAVRGEMNQFR
jgi:Ca2+-binding EF-hand superfamily protein